MTISASERERLIGLIRRYPIIDVHKRTGRSIITLARLAQVAVQNGENSEIPVVLGFPEKASNARTKAARRSASTLATGLTRTPKQEAINGFHA